MEPGWQPVVDRLSVALGAAGLDIVRPFDPASFRDVCPDGHSVVMLGRTDTLGVLVGNTHALWPKFIAALAAEPRLASEGHPLDAYVQQCVAAAAADCGARVTNLVYAHTTEPAPFPFARLAEAVGLAAIAPSHLAIHPIYGPWFALRAALVVDVAGPAPPPQKLQSPCQGCEAPCVPALARAIAASGSPLTSASIATHAEDWIAVRDVCPVGRAFRYGETQLRYHYAPSKALLGQGV